jgi:phosphatidylglycerol:prolipoprotein diacylglycerol transferase
LAIAYGVGRLGCHIAGDGDWGAVTDVPWGVAYTNAIIGWVDPMTGVPYPPGVLVHPTPIYEFLQSLIIFGILWSMRNGGFAPGTIAWLYLVMAGFARFTVEFWRVNLVLAFGLSEAQWISLFLMATGLIMLMLCRMRPAC